MQKPCRFRVAIELPVVVFAEARERADLGVVGERRDRPDTSVGHRAPRQRLDPARCDNRVRIEQNDIGTRQCHAAIRGQRESQVPRVLEQMKPRIGGSLERCEVVRDAWIRRGIVDQYDPAAFGRMHQQ